MPFAVDVLIPTCHRPSALAITLASLCGQQYNDFRVLISDQSDEPCADQSPELRAVLRVLATRGHEPRVLHHLPRQGMAEQRAFLLSHCQAPYALFLDDDLVLEPAVIGRMLWAIESEQCGFVGCAVIGLSYLADERPHEQQIEFWEGRVLPEHVTPDSPAWQRYLLHNAANVFHVERRLGLHLPARRDDPASLQYKVAWVGGCVMYDAQKLGAVGGFDFWRDLPSVHCGEDVLAQLRVMARYGGCGLLPSGVYHQELETTLPDRRVNAPRCIAIAEGAELSAPEERT